MKTTDFIKENESIGQDAHDMHQDHQHQMLREECYHIAVNSVALHKLLLQQLPEHIPLDAWAAEKISLANDYIKTVKEWLEYDVMGAGKDVPSFDPAIAESKLARDLNQDLLEDLNNQFDMIEDWVEQLAEEHGVDAEQIWEDFDAVDDATLLETAAWQKKSGKNKNGGLNKKGVASYRKEHPGSKLQTAVTTKPSKLKKGSKAAKRRKSFCARMGGMKGPMKDEHGKPTRKALALRKWNCHESVMEAANAAQQAAIAINKKKEQGSKKTVKENATGGATGASSVAVSMTQEGNYPAEMVARQKTYSNQRTKGGTVKIKAAKK